MTIIVRLETGDVLDVSHYWLYILEPLRKDLVLEWHRPVLIDNRVTNINAIYGC